MSIPAEPEKDPARGSLAGLIALLLVITSGVIATLVDAPGFLIIAVLVATPLLVREACVGRRRRRSAAMDFNDATPQLFVALLIVISSSIAFTVTCTGVGLAGFRYPFISGAWSAAAILAGIFTAALLATKMVHWLWPRE